jgi:single-stranded DNA-binding protein
MAETSSFLVGNLTSDPELHHSPGGTARATFRVAVSSRIRDGEQWRGGGPAFYSVVVWRDQAEHAAASLSEGQPGRGRRPLVAADKGCTHPLSGAGGHAPR